MAAKRRVAATTALFLFMALIVGCSWLPPQLGGPSSDTPEQLRELQVYIYPPNCSSYTLNPPPYTGNSYVSGTQVTITLSPVEGCVVTEWFNVDLHSGPVGEFTMDNNRVVQVNLTRGAVALTAAASAVFGRRIILQTYHGTMR